MKIYKIIIIIFILIAVGFGGYFIWQKYYPKSDVSVDGYKISESTISISDQPVKLDPIKELSHLSKIAGVSNAYWTRGNDIMWQVVEPKKGKINWEDTDQMVKMLNKEEMYSVVLVQPFANWDQIICHKEDKYIATGMSKRGSDEIRVGAPCDMQAYADFIAKAVERYDGDGVDDMPGLILPIKYWEIMNEPSMQGGGTGGMGEELKFFVGTSEEYLNTLKTSYKAIKAADPDAKVLHAGMAGMNEQFQEFWEPIYEGGAGDYFDIANLHTINTDEKREDLYIISYLKFLSKYGLEDRPIFMTEVQYGELAEKPSNLKDHERLMVKSTVFSLALGVDKLFYIDNWVSFWDQDFDELKKQTEKKEGMDIKDDKDKFKTEEKNLPQNIDTTTHRVYTNLVDKLNHIDKITTIKQEYIENPDKSDGATSIIGQYKFTYQDNDIYVMWGKADMPSEISGQVKVTDIYGESEERQASEITLSNDPIFVEIL